MRFIKLLILGAVIGATGLFGDATDITNIVDDTSTQAQSVFGTAVRWGVSVFFPLISMVAMAVFGYSIAKKKVEQTQDGQSKIPLYVVGGAVVGAFVYIIVTALFFQLVTGDAANAATVVNDFYRTALGI